jgi:hypothetical protein
MTAILAATLALVAPGNRCFQVTPKGRVDGERTRQQEPWPLVAVSAATLVSAVWFALTVTGRTPLHYGVPWAAYGAFAWLAFNGVLVAMAMNRIGSLRFAGERRASVRFDLVAGGRIADQPCRVADLSLTGTRVVLPARLALGLSEGEVVDFEVELGERIVVTAEIRSRRPAGGGAVALGLQFVDGQDPVRARLALALFQSEAAMERVAPPNEVDLTAA